MAEQLLKDKNILLINDDLVQLAIFKKQLMKAGANVHFFHKPEVALEKIFDLSSLDLVITDLYMPVLDGWKVCRCLRSKEFGQFNHIPILVTSATFSGAEAVSITKDIGANAFASVPVPEKEFIQIVQSTLNGQETSQKNKILVIEDDIPQQKLLKRYLEKENFLVTTASSGEEADRHIEQDIFDIAIIDFHLPDTSGDQILKKIKKQNTGTACIMVTADHQPQRSVELLRLGATSYLTKPFSENYLVELMYIALRERSLLNVENLLERRTQESLRNERNYNQLLNHIPLGVFEIDPEGRVCFVNIKWQTMTGLIEKQVLGRNWTDFISPSEQKQASDFWEEIQSHDDPSELKKCWGWAYQERELGSFELTFSWREARDSANSPRTLVGILEDIEAKQKLEKIRAREKVRAFHAHKMICLGELSSGVAHEINNPLTIALFNSQKIIDRWDDLQKQPSQIKSTVQKIESSCQRIVKIVQSLRVFTDNYEEGALSPISITQALHEIPQLYHEKLQIDQIELSVNAPSEELMIYANYSEISQVLVNLLENAHYALKEDLEGKNKKIHMQLEEIDGMVVLSIEDNSTHGIPSELAEKIFEPFFTTKSPLHGSGLGLSFSLGILSKNGGSLSLKSTSNPTAFEIKIPKYTPKKEN